MQLITVRNAHSHGSFSICVTLVECKQGVFVQSLWILGLLVVTVIYAAIVCTISIR